MFGKEATDLSIAEQFVLASAVNRPIILLEGSERLNAVRLDRWRYLTEVRARICAEKLIADRSVQKQVIFDLVAMAAGPPDPKIKPKLQEALDRYAPALAQPAQANPVIRANALMPAARYGIREEMKQAYGFGWRDHVRGITTTFDAVANLRSASHQGAAGRDRRQARDKIDAGFTLDPPRSPTTGDAMPDVIVVAANATGEIVRYFEPGETASYFGSPSRAARDRLLRCGARKPHGRLDRQDHRGHRHRQHAARSPRHALPRHAGAGAAGSRPAPKRRRGATGGAPSSPSPARSTIR